MLFGIEKEWAEEFASLYKTQSPAWYVGQGGPFHASTFGASLGSLNTAATYAFAPPVSSAGSGFGAGSGGW